MKKIIAAALLSAPFAVGAADFTGLNVWVGGQYADAKSKAMDSSDGYRSTESDTNYDFTAGLDYGIELTDRSVLLLGASWSGKIDSGTHYNSSDPSTAITEISPDYMLYVAPGFKITDSTLVYGKLSYSKTEFKGKYILPSGTLTRTDDDKSLGYGIGIRSYITDSTFLNAELDRVEYDFRHFDTVTADATVNRFTLAVGYSF